MTASPRRARCRAIAAGLVAAAPLLAAAVAGPAAAQAPDPTSIAAGLPDGRTVLERAVQAMGGREAFEKVESLAMEVVIGTPAGELRIEALSIDEDRLRLRLKATLDRRVEAIMTKNGDVAWMTVQPLDDALEPVGEPTLMPNVPTSDLRRFGAAVRAHWMVLRLLEDYETFETVEITQFQEQPALKVRAADPRTERGRAAAAGDRYFFVSLADGMPLGIDAPMDAPDARQVLAFRDVEQHGDLRLWTRMTGSAGTVQQSFVFESIVFNVVPRQAFAIPPAVQERVDAEEAAKAGAAPDAGTPVNPIGRGG